MPCFAITPKYREKISETDRAHSKARKDFNSKRRVQGGDKMLDHLLRLIDRFITPFRANRNMTKLVELIEELKTIQKEFKEKFGCPDIISSSKFFEVLIANELNHDMIGGFSGHRDAKDQSGNEYEYKHYKESSSNHTWTFNDFSDATIAKLKSVRAVIFAHFDDSGEIPVFDWCYPVSGKKVSSFLAIATIKIKNNRKMINVSSRQIETIIGIKRLQIKQRNSGKYFGFICKIFQTTRKIEQVVGTKNILTSNKIWEVLVALKLGHKVITEQKKFDATDSAGNLYEYKVARNHSWNFEDISPNVLQKFKSVKKIILATIDKPNFEVLEIYETDPLPMIGLLESKLEKKKVKYAEKGGLRRLQVSVTLNEINNIGATLVFHK